MATADWASVLGVVFDMDGVLILSRGSHRQAFEEILSGFGVRNFDYDRYAGWKTREVFQAVFAEHPQLNVSPETIAECSRQKSERARELLAQDTPLAPGCVSLVRRMAERYKVALASSGSRASVDAFLEHTGLRGTFRSVLSGDDVTHAKPHPEIFERSIQSLGLDPQVCVVVEDAVAGVQAARLAGARAIGVDNSFKGELIAAGAVSEVRSLQEIAGILL